MRDAVLHSVLPKAPWMDPAIWRLPGMQPLDQSDWLIRDEAFAGQMALRDHLIAERPSEVIGLLPGAEAAARECLTLVLDALRADPGYRFEGQTVRRPDGVTVTLGRDTALATLGRLQQGDICLMEQGPHGHVLTAANLCFPAQWTLAEKLGKPLGRIHVPVAAYDAGLARRVQRLFDAIRPGQLLWRANALLYREPHLFSPLSEDAAKERCPPGEARYLRSERQTIRRLSESNAVVFTIHTYMIALENLSQPERQALACSGLERE